jgi:hypothetical protein
MTEKEMIIIAKEEFANLIPAGSSGAALKLLIYMRYAETMLHLQTIEEIEQYVEDCIGKKAYDQDPFYLWYFKRYCVPPPFHP